MATYEPTLLDIANLVDASASRSPCEDTPEIVRWLICQSPAARELYDQLHAEQEDRPTLFALAKLLVAVEATAEIPESRPITLWLIQQSAIAQKHYLRLEEMAQETGDDPLSHISLLNVVQVHQLFERLLAAPNDWTDPAEVLDPTESRGVPYEALWSICQTRLGSSPGKNRQRLRKISRKLKRCAELQATLPSLSDRLDQFNQWLDSVADPAATIRKLEGILGALRQRQAPSIPHGAGETGGTPSTNVDPESAVPG
jgi:hypothetical protein